MHIGAEMPAHIAAVEVPAHMAAVEVPANFVAQIAKIVERGDA